MTTIQDFFASGDGNTNEVHIGNHGYDGVCSWTRGRKERNSERLRGRGKELVGGMEVFAELQAGLKIVDCTVVGFYIMHATRKFRVSSSRYSNPIVPIVWLLASLTEKRRKSTIHFLSG
ncbi:hypothetical protein QR685DRAFT_437020 [Neurospora intermedia]|uniref:Uncharacterized protein n=1 Tax=Neurospora intermedia TaxID=5142 RepID=A0ABR3DJH8_NEUIN